MRWLSICGLLVSVLPAYAEPDMPPKRYDRPHPDMTVLRLAPDMVTRLCAETMNLYNAAACALIGDGEKPCVVLLPIGAPKWFYRHERAHCVGWPADHPR